MSVEHFTQSASVLDSVLNPAHSAFTQNPHSQGAMLVAPYLQSLMNSGSSTWDRTTDQQINRHLFNTNLHNFTPISSGKQELLLRFITLI